MAKIDRWLAFSLSTERDLAACRSWFAGMISDADKLILAEGYENDDGTMPRIRVLFERRPGDYREAICSQGKRTWTIKVRAASIALMKRAKVA